MKSVTLHKLDNDLYQMLLKKAKEQNLSLNKFAKKTLRAALGLNPKEKPKRDFSDLIGIYDEGDWDEIQKTLDFFDNVSLSPNGDESMS